MAHITGGGFIENIPRMLPKGLAARVNLGKWDMPDVFAFLKKQSGLSDDEMYNIYNMGIGFVMVVSADYKDRLVKILENCGERAFVIGDVVASDNARILFS